MRSWAANHTEKSKEHARGFGAHDTWHSPYLAHFDGFFVLVHAHKCTSFARVTWQFGRGGGDNKDPATKDAKNWQTKRGRTLVEFFVDAHARVRIFESFFPHFGFCVSGAPIGEQNVGGTRNVDGLGVSDEQDLCK